MGGYGSQLVAFVVTLSLGLYFCVIFVQLSLLVVDGYMSKWQLVRALIPALCKNIGIACAILGFTFQIMTLAAVGTLLIPVGLLLAMGNEIKTPAMLETALRGSAILSLGSLSVFYMFV
jgi:hypothetical protein